MEGALHEEGHLTPHTRLELAMVNLLDNGVKKEIPQLQLTWLH